MPGCAGGTSASALDAFFRPRIGPVVGHDYQHVYPLGGDRHLWLFQDTFIDHSATAPRLDQSAFAHNTAMVQQGSCFTLLHRGTATAPQSFETGTGEQPLSRWFWPLGGETVDGRLHVFWVEMAKTADPTPPDGLGWVPARTWLATYDASTLTRLAFRPAPAAGVDPVYGFAVASDDEHTLPVRQHVRPEPRAPGWLLGVSVLGHRDVPRPRAPRPVRRLSRVPHVVGLEHRPVSRRADRRPLPRREPDAAALPRRSLGRGDEGRRVLGRRAGDRRRRPTRPGRGRRRNGAACHRGAAIR